MLIAPDSAIADEDGRVAATRLAETNGWKYHRVQAGDFLLTAYSRITDPADQTLAIYIGGDGAAWPSPTQPPVDPTPRVPRTFELAVRDPSPNSVYIARPCQFLDAESLAQCSPDYWFMARYAPEVVASMDLMVDYFVRTTRSEQVRLFGYSGGGVIAALVAANRDDVAEIVTVAANLDHEAWTTFHGISRLRDSLNAASVAAELAAVPQVHFVGADDTNVPVVVAEAYLARMPDDALTEIVVVDGMAHNCCWVDVWPDLLAAYGLD